MYMPRIATGRNSEISILVIKIAVVGTVGGMILTGKKRSRENKNNLDQYTHIHTLLNISLNIIFQPLD